MSTLTYNLLIYKMKNSILSILICFIFNQNIIAQNEQRDEQLDSLGEILLLKPYLQIGVHYFSQVAYNGRTEGIKQYGIQPELTLHIGKNWTLNYEGSIWSASSPTYALTSIGLAKAFKTKDFDGQIGYNRLFFNDGIALKRAEYTLSVEATLGYALNDFSFEVYGLELFGKSSGTFIEPSIGWETSGRFGENRQYKWHVRPKINADFGNDAVSQIIKKRKVVVQNNSKKVFGLLNYQLSAILAIQTATTDFEFTFDYNLPQNTTLPNSNKTFSFIEIEIIKRFSW